MTDSAKDRLKNVLLHGAKACRVFEVASRMTADRLRILCYHGTSFEREHQLYPGTFMRPETFRQRMTFLRDWGATVLSLEDALEKLQRNALPKKAVIITIDDGWYGSYANMLPVLQEFGFPATIYLSTYYIEKQTFVFNLMVEYLLLQASRNAEVLDLGPVDPRIGSSIRIDSREQIRDATRRIVDYGESNLDFLGREDLCFKLAACCGYDIDKAQQQRMFRFMSLKEAAELSTMGFDVQLHTHTHTFSPDDKGAAAAEIEKNVQVLHQLGISSPKHFCYPSGEYVGEHAAWLQEMKITSAVTTDFGLATPDTPVFYLPRICDSDAMGELDFEAAVSGFKDLVLRS